MKIIKRFLMKNKNKIFEDLFVLDLANNHFGDFS